MYDVTYSNWTQISKYITVEYHGLLNAANNTHDPINQMQKKKNHNIQT